MSVSAPSRITHEAAAGTAHVVPAEREPGVLDLFMPRLASLADRFVDEAATPANDRVATPGEPCTALWVVRSGSLLVRQQDDDGELVSVAHLLPGDIYGTHCLDTNATHAYFVHASGASVLARVPAGDVRHALGPRDAMLLSCLGIPAVRRFGCSLARGARSRDAVAELLRRMDRRTFASGAKLLAAGEAPHGLLLLARGRVRLGRRLYVPGDLIAAEATLLHAPLRDPAIALTDGEVHRVPLTMPSLASGSPAAAPLEGALRSLVAREATERRGRPQGDPTDLSLASVVRESADDSDVTLSGEARRPGRWARLPFVEQRSETDCGPACLQMIARYYDVDVGYAVLREITGVTRFGASLLALARAASKLGFTANGVEATWEQLAAIDLPAIVHLAGRNHFVVLWRATPTHVVIGDPSFGSQTLGRTEFEGEWRGVTLLVSPSGAASGATTEVAPALIPRSSPGTLLARLAPLLRPQRGSLPAIFVSSVALQALGIVIPLATQVTLDRILGAVDPRLLNLVFLALLVAVAGSGALSFARAYLVAYMATKVERRLIEALYERVLAGASDLFERFSTSDMLNRFVEVNLVKNFVSENAVSILVDLTTVVTYGAVLAFYDVRLALVVYLFVPTALAVSAVTARRVLRHTFAFRLRNDRLQTHLMDAFKAFESIKLRAIERELGAWMRRLLGPSITSGFRASVHAAFGASLVETLQGLVGATVLFLGARRALAGTLSLGQLAAFTMLARQVTLPVVRVAQEWSAWQRTLVSGRRIADLLDEPAETITRRPALVTLDTLTGNIAFRGVRFHYGPASPTPARHVLDGLDVEIRHGETVGIIGPSGCGKSTLARLILRAEDPTEGVISVDGFDLRDVAAESIRRQVGYVTQQAHIFSATVYENIAAGRDVTPDDVVAAARVAGAYQFISELPYGFDTKIGERGAQLSGGQQQRINIARALVTRPSVLIFDEATAALDPISEEVLYSRLARVASGRTTLLITHRIATLRNVDRVLVFEQGRLVEDGSPAELEAKRGIYYGLSMASPTWGAHA